MSSKTAESSSNVAGSAVDFEQWPDGSENGDSDDHADDIGDPKRPLSDAFPVSRLACRHLSLLSESIISRFSSLEFSVLTQAL